MLKGHELTPTASLHLPRELVLLVPGFSTGVKGRESTVLGGREFSLARVTAAAAGFYLLFWLCS